MDKKQEHIDEDFLNQSWANMSQILDKEMPVKKRKRRFVWLWLSGLAALTFVVIAYANNSIFIETNTKPITPKKELIIEAKKDKVADNQLIDLKKENLSDTPISTSKQSIDTPSAINTIKNLTLASPSEPLSSTIGSEAGILEDGGRYTVDGSRSKDEVIETVSVLSKVSDDRFEKTTLNKPDILDEPRLFISDFGPLSTIDFYPIFNKNESVTFPTIPLKKKKNWHFGVYAGKVIPKLGSFRAGIHAQKIINQKWALYFGLGYAKRVAKISLNKAANDNANVELETIPLPDMDEEDMMAGAGTAPVQSPIPPDNISSNIYFQNFHYIELPILIQYQLNNRWSLELGGQISRLYGYRYRNEDNLASTFSLDPSFSADNADLLVRDLTESQIASWDFAVLGGTAFKLNPQFQLYTNYKLGLNNYLPNTNNKKWRQIELGVRYYFK